MNEFSIKKINLKRFISSLRYEKLIMLNYLSLDLWVCVCKVKQSKEKFQKTLDKIFQHLRHLYFKL